MTVEFNPVELESAVGEHILGVLDTTHSQTTENIDPHTYRGSLLTKLLHSHISQNFVPGLGIQAAQKVDWSM